MYWIITKFCLKYLLTKARYHRYELRSLGNPEWSEDVLNKRVKPLEELCNEYGLDTITFKYRSK